MQRTADSMADRTGKQESSLPISCPECAAQMPAAAAFCPACGIAMQTEKEGPTRDVGMFGENVAGALAYLTFIPAIVFLLKAPYKTNQVVRFHSAQSLLLWIAGILIAVTLKLAGLVIFFIPVAGPLFVALIYVVGGLAIFTIWAVLVVKALQGETYGLPVLGALAELYAVSHKPGQESKEHE